MSRNKDNLTARRIRPKDVVTGGDHAGVVWKVEGVMVAGIGFG